MFKHHSYFAKERDEQSYRFPFVCFVCRKSFRKPYTVDTRVCPECSRPMVMLSRKFSAPRKHEIEQWKKVQVLVEHGFLFQSVYAQSEGGGAVTVPYPKRLADVAAFVAEYQGQAGPRPPAAWGSAHGVKRASKSGT